MSAKTFIALLLLGIGVVRSGAEILLPPQFSDNMVLQRGIKNRIWGERTGGESVWVEFQPGAGTRKAVPRSASVRRNGWEIDLDIPEVNRFDAARPGTITIWEGKKSAVGGRIALTNVVIGDVWFIAVAAGQGMSGPPRSFDALRVLELPDARQLGVAAAAGGVSWNPTPDRVQLITSDFAFTLFASREKNNFPIGVIETTPEALQDFLRGHFRAKRTADGQGEFKRFEQLLKEARTGPNKAIQDENARIERGIIEEKHSGVVSAPSLYQIYSPFELVYRADDFSSRLVNFEGAIRPATAPVVKTSK